MSFIAGSYTATYGGSALGQILQGFRLSHSIFKQLIRGDNFAQTPQDAVFQGIEVNIAYALMEYNAAAARAAFWRYGATYLTMDIVIGTLDSANGGALVLTAKAGTPAASTPASITLTTAALAENFPVEILFAPELRTVPIRQRIYPNVSGVFGVLT